MNRSYLSDYFRLLRVRQWIKNFFIIFPLVFSGKFFDPSSFSRTALTIIAFSLLSGSVYILNDFLDLKQDRHHPQKLLRPLAAGVISKRAAGLLAGICLAGGLWLTFYLNIYVFELGLLYVLLHLFYNYYAKKAVILDVIVIAMGFQVRMWSGAVAIGVDPSGWLQLSVFILAMFLGFAKRRHELVLLADKAVLHRPVLSQYSPGLLDNILMICATLTVTFYSFYTISSEVSLRMGNSYLVYSIIFVIYGVFRYLYLIYTARTGGDPAEVLLSDRALIVDILLWVLFMMAVFYKWL